MNPVTDQMTIKEENLITLEVKLPVKVEEDNSIKVVLQDIVIEVHLPSLKGRDGLRKYPQWIRNVAR